MTARTPLAAPAALLAALAASPAAAASVAETSGWFALTFDEVPRGIYVYRDEDGGGVHDHVERFTTRFDLGTEARAEEAVDEQVEVVDSFLGAPSVFVQNHDGPNPEAVAPGPVTLSGVLDYGLSASAAVDDAALDDAMGAVMLEMYVGGDPFDGDEPAFRVETWADAGRGAAARRGSHRFDLTIAPRTMRFGRPGLETVEIGFFAEAWSAVDDVSPAQVPLPASLPAMIAGLGALAFLCRRP